MLVVDSADVLGSEEDILCANVKGKLGQLEKEEEEEEVGQWGGACRGKQDEERGGLVCSSCRLPAPSPLTFIVISTGNQLPFPAAAPAERLYRQILQPGCCFV